MAEETSAAAAAVSNNNLEEEKEGGDGPGPIVKQGPFASPSYDVWDNSMIVFESENKFERKMTVYHH